MDICELLLKSLSGKSKCEVYTEDFDKVSIDIITDNCMPLSNKTVLDEIINNISERDSIICKIFECNENDEFQITSYSNGDKLEDFISDIRLIELEENIAYRIRLKIVKHIDNNELSIYSLEKFVEYLKKIQLTSILSRFNDMLSTKIIIFRLQNYDKEFNSESIFFLNKNSERIIDLESIKNRRNIKIKQIRRVCKLIQTTKYKLISDDFNFENCEEINLKSIMNKIKVILSIISICDISDIKNENEIEIIINGYKRIETIISYHNISEEKLLAVYEIEKWIYSDEKIEDKIGIARNIISISSSENLSEVDDNLVSSIKSAHSIYLKENVKEYLEVKSKISEFNFDLMQKMSESAKDIGKSLNNNIMVVATFYGTVIVMNILSDKRLENIFTKDITNLSLGICLVSIIYLLLTKYSIKKEIEVFEKQYCRVKNYYNEILESEDIDNIFKHNKYLIEDIKFIQDKANIYSLVWIILILVLIVIIYHLGYIHVWDLINGFSECFKKLSIWLFNN